MEPKDTTPAKTTYRVWASRIRRVCQEVETESPEQAHHIAWLQPERWRDSPERGAWDEYRLVDDVQVAGMNDYFTVVDIEHCDTCGDEIEPAVNGSAFHSGECGVCEHQRYLAQPALLTFARSARAAFEGLLSSLAEERCSVLRGGGTEEDCRDIDDRIAHYEHLIEAGKKAVTGPERPRLHDFFSPTQDDNP